jgi:hypothetical protein
MILVEMIQAFRRSFFGNREPYIASKGSGRWVIRFYDSVGRRWTDSGQTFFNKRDAELRLKEARDLLRKRAG